MDFSPKKERYTRVKNSLKIDQRYLAASIFPPHSMKIIAG